MKTYKVKSTMSVDVEIEIDAENEKQAFSKFYAMDFTDVVENGVIQRADSEETDAELVEATFIVKTKTIKYEVEDYNIGDAAFLSDDEIEAEKERIRNSLPQVMTLEVNCRKEDLDTYVAEKILDETSIEVSYVDYDVIEEK